MTRLVVAALLCLSGLVAGCTDFSEDGGGLAVQGIDVAAPEVGAGRLTLAVLATVDNDGGRSGAVNVTVKAYDGQTGLLAGSATQPFGRLPAHKTRTLETRIELPRAPTYRLTVDLQESGRLVQRANLDARNLAALEANTHETGLRIAASDFRLLATDEARAQVQASTYLTNEGKQASPALTLQVRARDERTSLVVAEEWTAVAVIRPDATRPVNVTLDVPVGHDYAVEVTLWDGDVIVERGGGRIQFGPVTSPAPPTGVVVSTPTLSDLVYDRDHATGASGKSSKSPGLGPAAVGLAVVGAAVLARRRLA